MTDGSLSGLGIKCLLWVDSCPSGLAASGQDGMYWKRIMTNSKKPQYCTICARLLDNTEDPLSGNTGGDCWACIGAIEAEMGCAESLAYVRKEHEAGLRPGWIDPFKP